MHQKCQLTEKSNLFIEIYLRERERESKRERERERGSEKERGERQETDAPRKQA